MARQVGWTATAWADLESIADFIAQDSPTYAAAFVREARDAARSLSDLGLRGRVVPEFNNPEIRELILGTYRLIHQISELHVRVLELIHGARDLGALWESEGRGT